MYYNIYVTTESKERDINWSISSNELIATLTPVLSLYVKRGGKAPLTISIFPREGNVKDKE